jgi:hypothetical protein
MKEGNMDRNRRSKKALGHLVSFLAFTGANPPVLEGARPSRKRVLTGDTRALAVDPANPAKLYAGTSGGGVFKSTNRGASWPVLNTGLTNRSVNALAIDPATSREVIVEHGKPEILSQDAFAHKQSMRTDADEIAEVVRA